MADEGISLEQSSQSFGVNGREIDFPTHLNSKVSRGSVEFSFNQKLPELGYFLNCHRHRGNSKKKFILFDLISGLFCFDCIAVLWKNHKTKITFAIRRVVVG